MSARIWRWRRSRRFHDIHSLTRIRRHTVEFFASIEKYSEQFGLGTPEELERVRKQLGLDRDPLTPTGAKWLQRQLSCILTAMLRREKARRSPKLRLVR